MDVARALLPRSDADQPDFDTALALRVAFDWKCGKRAIASRMGLRGAMADVDAARRSDARR